MGQLLDVLVVSPSIRSYPCQERMRLARLILPTARVPTHLYCPPSWVWWAERKGKKTWLRGYFQVERDTGAIQANASWHCLVWQLSAHTAERLTWPGTSGPASADISDLVASHSVPISDEVWVSEISAELSISLQKHRDGIAEGVHSYEWALRHIGRLIQSTRFAQHARNLCGDVDQALAFARDRFARSELVQFSGWDAYAVAAAVLAGYHTLPPHCIARVTNEPEHMPSKVVGFRDLNPDNLALSGQAWDRNSESLPTTEALERSSQRHQQILKSLVEALMARGIQPTYNQWVDIHVVLHNRHIFFEIKTANRCNFLRQTRLAIGQLLEYRFRHQIRNGESIRLVVVIDRVASKSDIRFAQEFLDSLGIQLILWKSESGDFPGLLRLRN